MTKIIFLLTALPVLVGANPDCADDSRVRVAVARYAVPICEQLPAGQMPGLTLPVGRSVLSPWECGDSSYRCQYLQPVKNLGVCVEIKREHYVVRYVCGGVNR